MNGDKLFVPIFWVGMRLGIYALFLLIQGVWKLHYALNPKTTTKSVTAQPALRTSVTTAFAFRACLPFNH